MIDSYEIAIGKALSFLSSIETTFVLSTDEKKKLGFKTETEVWKVLTEISNKKTGLTDITFYVEVGNDFPLSFPRIYLDELDYEKVKYIPHLDTNRYICTYDTDLTRPIPENLEVIIPDSLHKAKRIINEGLEETNFQDFEEEFLSYWACHYSATDTAIQTNILCLFNTNEDVSDPYIIKLNKKIGDYKYILHNNDLRAKKVKDFLQTAKADFNEQSFFFLPKSTISFTPPFDYTNGDTLQLIASQGADSEKRFERFINSESTLKLVLTSIQANNKTLYIGWFYKNLEILRNGYRPGSITRFQALNTFQRNEKVLRIEPQIFTEERLSNRTEGKSNIVANKFLIAGLGSIGSNLVYFLNSMNYPTFRLVDNDFLKVENIGRHLLGLTYTGYHKTLSLKAYLQSFNPIQEIDTKQTLIQTIIQKEPSYANDMDYIFLTTGSTNVEKWISEKISDGIIVKPVFFIWIEPHLSAGHCLFIHPSSKSFSDFFNERDYYNYNIISETYYESDNNNLTLKESGCQTTYIPYSSSNVLSFLGTLFPAISSIIENKVTESKSFTWIGNLSFVKQKGVVLSDYAKGKVYGNLIENK